MELPPDRIRILINASDGYEDFLKMGIDAKASNPPSVEQITMMIGAQKGRLYRLMGFLLIEPPIDVRLKIVDFDGTNLDLVNTDDPRFSGWFKVADEPTPKIIRHGDYLFDLVSACI
jgi:hypothetical protein